MKNSDVLFFTSATKSYLAFLPLYAYFVALSNTGAMMEFIVDNVMAAERDYADTLHFLRTELATKITLQEKGPAASKVAMDNTLRFVQVPTQHAPFVYIGDVDIMIVDNLAAAHGRLFEAGLPYSNVIRPGTKRLTGLHFTRWDAYYPIAPYEDLVATIRNDEEILYQIVGRSGHLERQCDIDAMGIGRPQHGIHMSTNRIPFSDNRIRVDWGFTWDYAVKTEALFSHELFPRFVASLPHASRMYLANLLYIQKGILAAGKECFLEMTRGKPVKEDDGSIAVFEEIYRTNAWRGSESVSGPSSSMARTKSVRENLPRIVKQYDIRSVLDAPCGDFFWMNSVAPNLPIDYIGADIVERMIVSNIENYRYKNVAFMTLDLRVDPLPAAELLFCRDCLFHMSYRDIACVLRNFLASDCSMLMTTSHVTRDDFRNTDIVTGGWRWFDLLKEPFGFPKDAMETVADGGGDRNMLLWRKDQILSSATRFIQDHL